MEYGVRESHIFVALNLINSNGSYLDFVTSMQSSMTGTSYSSKSAEMHTCIYI